MQVVPVARLMEGCFKTARSVCRCAVQVWHMVFHPAGNAGLATVLAAPRYTFMHQVCNKLGRRPCACVPAQATQGTVLPSSL